MSYQATLRPSSPKTRLFQPVFSWGLVFLSCFLVSLTCRVYAQTGQPQGQTQLTGHENHKISLKDASTLTRNFRNSHDENAITGEFFGKDALLAGLTQDNCVGLRIYYGNREDGTPVLVFVAVDKSGNDMENGFVGEEGLPCPPVCGQDNALTQDQVTISGLLQPQALASPVK